MRRSPLAGLALAATLLAAPAWGESTRYVLEHGVVSVDTAVRPAADGRGEFTLVLHPGEGVRLNAAAGVTVFVEEPARMRPVAVATGQRGRFYFTAPPTAVFTEPDGVGEVVVNFAYCPAARDDCLIDDIRVALPVMEN